MKTVFFGSPAEAVPALRALVTAGHDVVAAYTRPEKPRGRSRAPQPTPVQMAALELGLRVETPPGLRSSAAQDVLRGFGAAVFVVVAYGRLLPVKVLEMPALGVVNVHPSRLPLYRGPSPVAAVVLDGAVETGVSLMLLDEGMDTGPVVARSAPLSLVGTERAGELTKRLLELGAGMLPGVLRRLERGELTPEPQDDSLATVTQLLSREDGRIDWSQPARQIERMVRAYDPWPGAFTSWRGRILKVLRASLAESEAGGGAAPGSVTVRDRRIYVACANQGQARELELLELQLEGRRAIAAADFLNGNPGFDGSVLGD